MDESLLKRIKPYNAEAEQAVIGSMLMDKEAIIVASEIITADDFYQPQYQVVYKAILDLYNSRRAVDFVTILNQLKENGVPPEVCSYDFVGNIIRNVPTSANVRQYAEIVRDKSVRRKLIKVTEDVANKCYLDKDELDVILDDCEKRVFEVTQNRNTGENEEIAKIVGDALSSIEAASKNANAVTGVSTGFADLDYKTAGLQPSDLVLLAARPSMGKTALALNIAEHAAVYNSVPTLFFSLEMSRGQLANRLLAMRSRVDATKIRTGKLNEEEWTKLVESAAEIGDSGLILDDTPGISISELRTKCRKYKAEKNIGLVIIDYLQLMSGGGKTESRQQEISEISRALKSVAREINCPVLALSQLSRAVEARPDKRPMLSDLRESGAIEQDADVVMFIYRDEYYNHDSEDKGIAEVIIGKQRNGPTGTIKLGCQLEYTRFTNLER